MDPLTTEQRSRQMARVRSRDTKPEMKIRRLVHSLGFRYRLHCRDVPGKPDLVLRPRRKVIFVHGCFWHRHRGCARARLPKSRLDFWESKLEANRLRDARNKRRLTREGWSYMVIWECEAMSDQTRLATRIMDFLGNENASR